jgi:Rod binding domain-containing protein
MTGIPLPAPGLKPIDLIVAGHQAAAPRPTSNLAKAREAAQQFEAVFLKNMFEQMYTGIDGDGPFGGSGAAGVWRSFLTQSYADSFAKAGGIGVADQVYKTLLDQQEIGQ